MLVQGIQTAQNLDYLTLCAAWLHFQSRQSGATLFGVLVEKSWPPKGSFDHVVSRRVGGIPGSSRGAEECQGQVRHARATQISNQISFGKWRMMSKSINTHSKDAQTFMDQTSVP